MDHLKLMIEFCLNEQLNEWVYCKVLPTLEFDSVAVSSDVNTIEVLPNGFITPASITLSKDDESSVINTSVLIVYETANTKFAFLRCIHLIDTQY
jgi:hypothetical protein